MRNGRINEISNAKGGKKSDDGRGRLIASRSLRTLMTEGSVLLLVKISLNESSFLSPLHWLKLFLLFPNEKTEQRRAEEEEENRSNLHSSSAAIAVCHRYEPQPTNFGKFL